MKKTLFSLLTIFSLFLLTACGGGAGSNYDDTVTPKLGDTVVMTNFEVTLESYSIGKAVSQYETYQDLVYLDVAIKNVGTMAMRFTSSNIKVYSPQNILLQPINSTNYPTSIDSLAEIRKGGTTEAQIIFPFIEYGTYYIEFPGLNGTITAEIDIKE